MATLLVLGGTDGSSTHLPPAVLVCTQKAATGQTSSGQTSSGSHKAADARGKGGGGKGGAEEEGSASLSFEWRTAEWASAGPASGERVLDGPASGEGLDGVPIPVEDPVGEVETPAAECVGGDALPDLACQSGSAGGDKGGAGTWRGALIGHTATSDEEGAVVTPNSQTANPKP